MDVKWTDKARSDLGRLHDFLAPVNRKAATRVVRRLVTAPARLIEYPRIDERLEEFNPRELRRLFVGDYEMRYEIKASTIYVPRLWHAREDR
jgi:plasmid stabilization system protein ParE